MNNTRIILLDVDGTLVRHDTSLPDSAATAIRDARAKGHQIFICTGRAKAEIYPYLWDLGLDGMIGGNGSYIEHHGAIIHHQVLAPSVVDEAITWLDEHNLAYYLECNSGLFGSPHLPRQAGERTGIGIDGFRAVFPHMIYDPRRGHDDVNKISFVLPRGMDLDDLRARFHNRAAINTWSTRGHEEEFGEIGQLDVDKGRAVHLLARHLDRSPRDFIGMGDARSDLPMLQVCGTAVAMGQAPDEVQQTADLVTDTVDNDGLAKAFTTLGLV